jgi:hypothetical protein
MNSLNGPHLKPWRIKVTYQAADEYGKHINEGSIEEIWAGEHKIRLNYRGKKLQQNVYFTDRGILISGAKDLPVDWLALAQSQFVDSFYDAAFLEKRELEVQQRQIGNTKLNCISVKASDSLKELPGLLGALSCVTPELPILRISVAGNKMPQVVRNNPIKFQGRYIPQDIWITLQEPDRGAFGVSRITRYRKQSRLRSAARCIPSTEADYCFGKRGRCATSLLRWPQHSTQINCCFCARLYANCDRGRRPCPQHRHRQWPLD